PGADLVARVEDDALCLDLPALVVERAGGEGHSLEADDALRGELQLLRRAAAGALPQLELGLAEVGTRRGRVAAAGPGHVHQRVGVVDVAFARDRAAVAVVLDLVGADLALALAHLDVALESAGAVEPERGLVGGHVDIVAGAGLLGRGGRRRGGGAPGLRAL